MKHKAERLAERITTIVSSWPGVECVLSCEAAEADLNDPYFALGLDVYVSGSIPDDADRERSFGDPGAFESSRGREKDRFFLEGLPIRLEYKRTRGIEDVLEKRFDIMWVFRSSGTYMFYRLVHGKVLFQRSDWIDRVRDSLQETPDDFWDRLRETYQYKMEHCLSDLGGAALKDDRFFYYMSLTGFAKACSSALFAKNRRWEPSDRQLTDALTALPVLPEDFTSRWALLMRTDGGATPERKYQTAQLMARSVFALD